MPTAWNCNRGSLLFCQALLLGAMCLAINEKPPHALQSGGRGGGGFGFIVVIQKVQPHCLYDFVFDF